jgi:hypothetical protein
MLNLNSILLTHQLLNVRVQENLGDVVSMLDFLLTWRPLLL